LFVVCQWLNEKCNEKRKLELGFWEEHCAQSFTVYRVLEHLPQSSQKQSVILSTHCQNQT